MYQLVLLKLQKVDRLKEMGFWKKAQNSPADEGCASIKKVYVLINIFKFLWFQY